MDIICKAASPEKRVLIIHSWWGLTGSFRDYAEQLSAEGFAAGLSDLFDGRTARSAAEAKRLRGLPRKIPMYKSLKSDISELLAFGKRSGKEVHLIGFSMGGHWAVWLSQQPDLPIASTTLYYAARAGNFAQSRASFMAHYAEDDPWVSQAARKNMERALTRAKCSYVAYDYPSTQHWFAERDRSKEFNAPAARLAFERTVSHIASR